MKLWEKIIWGVIAGLLILMALCGIWSHIRRYLSRPMETTVHTQKQRTVPLPKIMICPLNPVNSTQAKSLRSDPDLVKYTLALSVPHADLGGDSTKGVSGWSNEMLDNAAARFDQFVNDSMGSSVKAYGSLGWQCSSTLSCMLEGKDFPCCKYTRTVPTAHGPCMFMEASLFHSDKFKQVPGLEGGLRITMDVDKSVLGGSKSLEDALPELQSRVMLVDQWRYNPQPALSLSLNGLTEVAVTKKLTWSLAYMEEGQQFRDQVSSLPHKGSEHPQLKEKLDCYSTCMLLTLREKCKCLPPYAELAWPLIERYPGRGVDGDTPRTNKSAPDRICTLKELLQCPHATVRNQTILSMADASYLLAPCMSSCRNYIATEFVPTVTVTRFDRPTPPDKKAAGFAQAILVVYMATFDVQVIEEHFVMWMAHLMADIGTTIAIYVVLFLLLWYGVKLCKYVCGCGWKRRRMSVNSGHPPSTNDYD